MQGCNALRQLQRQTSTDSENDINVMDVESLVAMNNSNSISEATKSTKEKCIEGFIACAKKVYENPKKVAVALTVIGAVVLIAKHLSEPTEPLEPQTMEPSIDTDTPTCVVEKTFSDLWEQLVEELNQHGGTLDISNREEQENFVRNQILGNNCRPVPIINSIANFDALAEKFACLLGCSATSQP